MKPSDQLLRDVTKEYLISLDKNNLPPIDQIVETLVTQTSTAYAIYNSSVDKSMKLKVPTKLLPQQIADLMRIVYDVRIVNRVDGTDDPKTQSLMIYVADGSNAGIYTDDEHVFYTAMKTLCSTLTKQEREQVYYELRYGNTEHASVCTDRDLIAVNNGIYDYAVKQLIPFSPDYVFISKSRVDYNPNAANVIIHNSEDNTDWDVEGWMQSLSDDPEVINLLWEILGAVIRSNVRWNKSAWLYSETGNNGKGTFCSLARNLCGKGSCVSIPVADMGNKYIMSALLSAQAIITDENPVGTYVDRSDAMKAVITGDPINTDRKYKDPITFTFHGFMIQCLNEMPKIRDRSDSIYRRQLFVPMEKCFTGHERTYIKDDYLCRKEVLEYVLKRVLESNYYTLSCPPVCVAAMEEYKEYNDPVKQFMAEHHDQFAWDFLPFAFLYDLYIAWFRKNVPSGSPVGSNTFRRNIESIISEYPEWQPCGKNPSGGYDRVSPKDLMDKPEYLSWEYNLVKWMQPNAGSMRPDVACVPPVKDQYRGGLIRVTVSAF